MDWSGCPFVTARPGFLSGAPALCRDPRKPAALVVENMELGESAQDVVLNYQLTTPAYEIAAIYDYARRHRRNLP